MTDPPPLQQQQTPRGAFLPSFTPVHHHGGSLATNATGNTGIRSATPWTAPNLASQPHQAPPARPSLANTTSPPGRPSHRFDDDSVLMASPFTAIGTSPGPARAEVNNQRTTRAVAAVTGCRKAGGAAAANDGSPDSVIRKLGFDADNTPPNARPRSNVTDAAGDAFPSLKTPPSDEGNTPVPGSLDGSQLSCSDLVTPSRVFGKSSLRSGSVKRAVRAANNTLMTLSPGSSNSGYAARLGESPEGGTVDTEEGEPIELGGIDEDDEAVDPVGTPMNRGDDLNSGTGGDDDALGDCSPQVPKPTPHKEEDLTQFDCLTITECPRCGKAFRTKADVQSHMLTCTTHRMRSGSMLTARTDDGSLDSLPGIEALGTAAEDDLMRTPMSLHSVPGPAVTTLPPPQRPQRSITKATPGTGGQTLFVHETPQVPPLLTPAIVTAQGTAPHGGDATNPLMEAFERVTAAENVTKSTPPVVVTVMSDGPCRVSRQVAWLQQAAQPITGLIVRAGTAAAALVGVREPYQVLRDPSTSLSPTISSGENALFGADSAKPARPALSSPPSMTAIPEAEVIDWDAEIETFLASVGSSQSSRDEERITAATKEVCADSGGTSSSSSSASTERQARWTSRHTARDSSASCTVEMNCTSMMLSIRDPAIISVADSNCISRIDHIAHKDLSILEPVAEEPYSITHSHLRSLSVPSGGGCCPDLLTGTCSLSGHLRPPPAATPPSRPRTASSLSPRLAQRTPPYPSDSRGDTTVEEPSTDHKCPHCGRTFASSGKLGVHERVCQRVFMTKRQPVDFRRYRAKNTALEAFVGSTFVKNGAVAAGPTAGPPLLAITAGVKQPQQPAKGSRKRSRSAPQTRRQTQRRAEASKTQPKSREPARDRPHGSKSRATPKAKSRLEHPASPKSLMHEDDRPNVTATMTEREAEVRSSLLSTARKSRGSLLAALARDESSACLVGRASLDDDWQRRSAELAKKYTSWSRSILRSSLEAANSGATDEATEEASLAAADLINPWDASRAPKGLIHPTRPAVVHHSHAGRLSSESMIHHGDTSRASGRAVTFATNQQPKPLERSARGPGESDRLSTPDLTSIEKSHALVGGSGPGQEASLPSSRMFTQDDTAVRGSSPRLARSTVRSSRASASIEDIVRKYSSMSKVEIVESPRDSRDKMIASRLSRDGIKASAGVGQAGDEHSSDSSDRPCYDPSKYYGDNSSDDDEEVRPPDAGYRYTESYPWSQAQLQPSPYFHPPLQHRLYMGPAAGPLLYPQQPQQYQALPCYYYPTVDPQPGRMYSWAGPYPTDLAVWGGGGGGPPAPPRHLPSMTHPGSYGG
ncbi:hypothetical protein FOL47_010562 [Perkinsus chesapeaki]|uniref:C2H2-type domain-containing protein n=1 Tax=Perkinsus chesapeaki TaxID=330153 RepID=A0A7J6L1A2_PERCH|nr:hypothetical protein FOL47_010562 [Perkinsus chesapeaki]